MADFTGAANSYADQYGIPRDIFAGLITQESGWDPNAQAQGSSAYGLTQLTKAAQIDTGVTDITDPNQQLMGGASYLSKMFDKFGNWNDALAAYNQGPGGDLSKGQNYASRIMGNKTQPLSDSASDDAAPNSSSGIVGTIKNSLGNAGLVMLGVVIVGIALFMSKPASNAIKTVIKQA